MNLTGLLFSINPNLKPKGKHIGFTQVGIKMEVLLFVFQNQDLNKQNL